MEATAVGLAGEWGKCWGEDFQGGSDVGHMQVTCRSHAGHMSRSHAGWRILTERVHRFDWFRSMEQPVNLALQVYTQPWPVVCIPTTISLNGTSIYMHLWLINMTPPHPPLRLWCVEFQNNIMCDYHLPCKSIHFWYWSKPGFLQLCPLKVKRCLINVDAMCTEEAGLVR